MARLLHTDAAKLKGLGFVLTQPRSGNPEDGHGIIWMDSTDLKDSETRYSQVEEETIGLTSACNKCENILRGADIVEVFTYCKPLQGLYQKNISDIKNSRQQLMEKIIPYNLNINHVKGNTSGVCDYKSRNTPQHSPGRRLNEAIS